MSGAVSVLCLATFDCQNCTVFSLAVLTVMSRLQLCAVYVPYSTATAYSCTELRRAMGATRTTPQPYTVQ